MKTKKIVKRNAFNLFITISDQPFDFELLEKKYNINLEINLTKKEFGCIFGQYWCCNNKSPYLWLYNENRLLCNLMKLFFKINVNLGDQFLKQFKIKDIIPDIDLLYESFLPNDGILYNYFVKNAYKDISYLLDSEINRDCFYKQLFYYDDCLDTYPNLSDDFYILLVGKLLIFNRKISISLKYNIINDENK